MKDLTLFQKRVYNFVRTIPRGKVSTYQAVAQAIGCPKAFRAVGNALKKNRDYKKIPCYRVVKSDGQVGLSNKGKKWKIRMLKKEGVPIKKDKIINFEKVTVTPQNQPKSCQK